MSQGEYVDGLRAPLIIHHPKEVYEYDEDFTIVISDWYHAEHDVLLKKLLTPNSTAAPELSGSSSPASGTLLRLSK